MAFYAFCGISSIGLDWVLRGAPPALRESWGPKPPEKAEHDATMKAWRRGACAATRPRRAQVHVGARWPPLPTMQSYVTSSCATCAMRSLGLWQSP